MTHRHTLLVVSVALAMLVSPTILAQETATATRNTTNESGETAGMGAQLTAFTQSSATAVNESVENGMWKAGFNQSNASDRARLVRNRTGTLEGRLDRLQRQNASLQERYENGTIAEPAYIAQQSRLSARIDALQTAVNDTSVAATRAGVNDSRLDRLRQNASNLTGPEVAAIARGLGGGPPADRGNGGPPADRGNGGPPANTTDAGPPTSNVTSERGQSANQSNAPANGPNNDTSGQSGTTDTANDTDTTDGSTGGSSGGPNDSTGDGSNSDTGGQQADDAPGRSST